jgi:putative transposase
MEFKNRKSNRLKNYDYSQNGMYFVTICTKNREKLFGEVVNGEMMLNYVGKITEQCWLKISIHFPYISLDKFVIMPNHIHGILEIVNNDSDVGNAHVRSKNNDRTKMSLSKVIQGFKSSVTRKILYPEQERIYAFPTKFSWQKSFHDRIIRNETELNKIREYIHKNPANWEQDRNNVENIWM